MEFIGLDVHKKQTQRCEREETGVIVVEDCFVTQRWKLREVFGNRSRAKILVEASTESEWVAEVLEELGHEVVVADPNYLPMYGTRRARTKTDKRDARALSEACRNGVYRECHRRSVEQREIRRQLSVRSALVSTRTGWINLIRALLRQQGISVPSGGAGSFLRRLAKVEMPSDLQEVLAPLCQAFEAVEESIHSYEERLEEHAGTSDSIARLRSVPGVGVLTALSFHSWLDGANRFHRTDQVYSAMGLVPRERSSSETVRRGQITKVGPKRTRSLLVEVAWRIYQMKSPATHPLREWMKRIEKRRGRKIAAVALARKLSGILYALERDQTRFDPSRLLTPLSQAA